MQNQDLLPSIDAFWEKKIVPTISEYIEIPAKSPGFDPQWRENSTGIYRLNGQLLVVLDVSRLLAIGSRAEAA